MTGPNTSQKVTSTNAPTTVKTLLAGSNPTPNISIITTSAGVNSSGIPQAIPINSSLSQVLRQLGNQSNVSINIQPINTLSAPMQLIQATPSNSNTSIAEQSESNGQSNETVLVVSSSDSNTNESSQNDNKM